MRGFEIESMPVDLNGVEVDPVLLNFLKSRKALTRLNSIGLDWMNVQNQNTCFRPVVDSAQAFRQTLASHTELETVDISKIYPESAIDRKAGTHNIVVLMLHC